MGAWTPRRPEHGTGGIGETDEADGTNGANRSNGFMDRVAHGAAEGTGTMNGTGGVHASTGWMAHAWPARHAALIGQLAAREVADRHRGQWLGWAWLVMGPLLMVAVYTLVLRHAMGVRWPGGAEGSGASAGAADLDFAVRLLCGLLPFNLMAECMSRAPRLVSDVPHLVKKVVFPLEVLPWVAFAAALAPLGVGVLVVVGALGLLGSLHATALWLPVVWLPLVPLCLGLGWLLAGIGTFVRDVSQLVAPALGALLFLSPIFYELGSLPPALRQALSLNPLAVVIEQTRAVLMAGQAPDGAALAWALLATSTVAVAGVAVFRRARPGFADVV